MCCYCFPPDRVKQTVNSKKETNSMVKMGKESKWAKGEDGLRSLPPDRVVNSKKETNSRVKMAKESKWAKSQDGLLLFTP